MNTVRRTLIVNIAFCVALVVFGWLCLFTGTVDIPVGDTCNVLLGGEASKATWTNIITELRIPMTVTAALAGAALAVAGLLLQTTFSNPLAGPSILGVTTGAGFGVAVALLTGISAVNPDIAALVGAVFGAVMVIVILLGMSTIVRSAMMLLIVGIMISYLTSSAISILNFYATQEGVHSYVIWGLGNFAGVGSETLPLYSTVLIVLLVVSLGLVKPLNAMLLGERYAANLGTNVKVARNVVLLVSGLLTAAVTAFCGPIGFIGLAIPHVARLALKTSNHTRLLPTTILVGAVSGLLTLWLSVLPGDMGMLPVNAITPIIGVPVVIYIILNRRRISYFN